MVKTEKKPIKKTKAKNSRVKASTAKKQPAERTFRQWFAAGARRVFKVVLAAGVVLCLIPVLLTPLYRVQAVHPISTLMLGRYLTGQSVEREWRNIDEISRVLKHSVVMSEDGQFCSHGGVDWGALNEVVENALDGEKTRGASTLTMQTVKNLFLWNSRSYVRKALELPLALWFDLIVPKKRILEIYLNIAEWDEGVFGIEAASQRYFNGTSGKLSRRQAALLTVTLPNPVPRNATKPSRQMRRVAGIIEKRARIAGGHVDCLE